MFKSDQLIYLALAGAALAIVTIASGKAKAVGEATASAAVDLATGVISGGVSSIGEAVGVPKTSLSECEKAKAEGRTWDASFACPAGDFLRYVWN